MSTKIAASELDPIAVDAYNGNAGIPPWYMCRNYEIHPDFQNMTLELVPLAKQFMRDGFIVLEDEIQPELCDSIIYGFYDFVSRNEEYFHPFKDENGFLQRIINLHLAYRPLLSLFSRSKRSLALQDALFSAETSVYTSLYYEKGSSQSIHRDTPYFCTRPEYRYFGTWFALEEANQDNGCLEVVRGGHLLPEIDREAFARNLHGGVDEIPPITQVLFDAYQDEVMKAASRNGIEKESVPVKKGAVLIWHPQLPHGGGLIRQPDRTRHSIVMHTAPVGVPVYQAYAFFNPKMELSEASPWIYGEHEGRRYARHSSIEVMHQSPREPSTFK